MGRSNHNDTAFSFVYLKVRSRRPAPNSSPELGWGERDASEGRSETSATATGPAARETPQTRPRRRCRARAALAPPRPSPPSFDLDAELAGLPKEPMCRTTEATTHSRECSLRIPHSGSARSRLRTYLLSPPLRSFPRSANTGCALSLRGSALEVYPPPPPGEAPPSDPPRRVLIGPWPHGCLSVVCTFTNSSRFRQSHRLIPLSIKTVATNRRFRNRPPPSSPTGRMDVGLATQRVGKVKWGVSGVDRGRVRLPLPHDTKMSQDAGFKLLVEW